MTIHSFYPIHIRKIVFNYDHVHGWGNGYVAISESNLYYGEDYNNIPVEVHGGLTYGKFMSRDPYMSRIFAVFREGVGIRSDLYVVGFDTMHYMDTPISCNKEFVLNETKNLAIQLFDFRNPFYPDEL